MPVVEIKDQDKFTNLVTAEAADRLTALYFYAPWAEPCKYMGEVFKALSDEPSNKDVLFLSINADDNSEIAESFEVSAVPCLIIVRKGTILTELSGANPKQFVKALNDHKASLQGTPEPQQRSITDEEDEDEDEETEEELNERLTKLTQAAPIMLFMKGSPSEPKCGFSRQMAVGILREHQVRFGFFDILKDSSVREGLKKFSDWPTFPQLYVKGEFQGGLDITKESLEEDPEFFEHALQSS
ncbi:hypothetical protein HG536_0H02970 [Torulaspora globosa]|uniref:Thioredoxin domain-containing protein n=1 Tax=Torulaspora globosa TaxID=48254 RepID=A0A7G3ZN36_9SACH|nr:uncharacterized protein HG536_0H02970 [Torulaspora globosa]QLL34922.1 hypothetical protein HG536_0H02970 [Torulaspora globosa]